MVPFIGNYDLGVDLLYDKVCDAGNSFKKRGIEFIVYEDMKMMNL